MAVNGEVYHDAFWLSYTGPDAGRTRWLQFIWREVVITADNGNVTRGSATVGAAGGYPYGLTTNPRSPVWNTDAARVAPTPFYEDTAADDRTAHSTEIYDAPEPLHGTVSGLFADPSTVSVASRAHFATYLVRDMEVLERIDIDVEWLYVSADQPEAAFRVVARGPVTSLAPAHRAVLRAQFPQFDYLP